MTHAREWLRRNVRVALGLPFSALLLSAAPARAADAAPQPPVAADVAPKSARELLGDRGNPANYEFAFVSVAAYQAWGLSGRTLLFGAGGGLGPPLYRYSSLGGRDATWDPSLEVIYGNVFLRVAPSANIELDVGPKIALLSTLYDAKDPPQSGFSVAGYADLRVGTKDVKFGPRFEYGQVAYHDYRESGWRLTPLMVRVVH